MSFLFDDSYYRVGKNGVSPFQNMHFHLCPIETRVGEMAKFGLSGIFRGQGIGIAKAIVSLTLFHEGRIYLTNQFKAYNLKKLD